MEQSKKGDPWCFGIAAHIGVDAESSLMLKVRGATGSPNDVTEAKALPNGDETKASADAGYQGADKRADAKPEKRSNFAMQPSKRKKLSELGIESAD
ncbi:MAG: hypothetical protein CFE41_15990 [Burkholderiales bacterium PBB2]|nr:MAG: hypothetical protein CFE41_15990 [Burkholderiales bacterium PBB2]